MANKLKNMELSSVDMCRMGANQEADICLFKSADGDPEASPPETPAAATSAVEKDYSTFGTLNANRENQEKVWQYTSALTESIRSIQDDKDLDANSKIQLMKKSLGEFDAAMTDLFQALCGAQKSAAPDYDEIEEVSAVSKK